MIAPTTAGDHDRPLSAPPWPALGFGLYLAVMLSGMQAAAQSDPVILDGPVDRTQLVGSIQAFVDPDWSHDVDSITAPDGPEFSSIEGKVANFGYTSSKIWLRANLENTTTDQSDWVVHFHENFKQVFEAFIVRPDGSSELVLKLEPDSTFSDRPVAYPQMVAPFVLAPGEKAQLLINLWSEGSSYIAFSFETRDSFAAKSARQTAKNFVFYGMMSCGYSRKKKIPKLPLSMQAV